MKRIIISWKSKNGVIMGAKVEDDVAEQLKQIEGKLNEENPQDPTKILSEFVEKDNLDFFNPVDVETSEYKIQIMED
jgi:hypothetical protein